jgi:dTDP-D-glucose 4,6-dehydratase
VGLKEELRKTVDWYGSNASGMAEIKAGVAAEHFSHSIPN